MRKILTAIFAILPLAALISLVGVFVLADQFKKSTAAVTALTEIAMADRAALANTTKALADLKETVNRMNVVQKSQDELLTQAVAKASPAVVSIAISKLVQQMEVTYENPFKNDPFFGGLDVRVPVYRPKGQVEQKVGAGTGFIIRSDGYILTNKHVVADMNAEYSVLLSDGSQKKGSVVYRDPESDLAVLKIVPDAGKRLPTITLANSNTAKLGQTVVAIGNALGEYDNSVSVGIISGLNRTIEATDASTGTTEILKGVMQTDAAINPGNSGGPLLTLEGEAIGVNVATARGSNGISFSIPTNVVKEKLKNVVKL